VSQQRAVQVGLRVLLGQREELDDVGIPEDGRGARVGLDERRRHLRRAEHRAGKQPRCKLPLELTFGPPLGDRHADVELALFGSLGLGQDDEVMRPRQL
jgi:hypothetical protein